MGVRMFVLWGILLPCCWGINELEQNLEALLNRQIITINGIKTTLRAIYGDIQPTVTNFNIGQKLLDAINLQQYLVINEALPNIGLECIGGVYVDRIFSLGPINMETSLQLGKIAERFADTPTVIATKIAQDMMIETSQLMLLIGHVRVGKSVTLKKIQYELHKLIPSSWSIRVDLEDLYPTVISHSEMTLEHIVQSYVEPLFLDLFYNLLEVNPKKIAILFDGVDQMTGVRAEAVVDIIKKFAEKGTAVILTGRRHTANLLRNQVEFDVCEISEMNIQETRKFLTGFWTEKALQHHTAYLSTNDGIGLETIATRVKHYVELFTHALFKTKLSRQPGPLMILAEKFNRRSPLTSGTYDLGCLDYTLNPLSSPRISLVAIEQVQLNKDLLYFLYINNFKNKMDNLEWDYGIVGSAQIICNKDASQEAAVEFMRLFDQPLRIAIDRIRIHHQYATFIDCLEDGTIKFIDEFAEFYASKFIMTLMTGTDTHVPLHLIQTLLSSSYYNNMLGFINAHVYNMEPTTLLLLQSNDRTIRFDILDNIILGGFDNLFHYFSNSFIGEKQALLHYLTEERPLNHQPKLVFGMIPSTERHPDENPFESLTRLNPIRTPLEFLIEYNMLRACKLLYLNGIWFFDHLYTRFHYKLIRQALTKSAPNLELVKFLMGLITSKISIIDLNNLLFYVIDEVGDGCQPVADYLVGLGALRDQASTDGQTLLHAAVKWNNVNLLRYVLETLQVPPIDRIDDMKRTVFAAALDANPSPLYTFDGWWEMMLYLVQNVKHLLLFNKPLTGPKTVVLPLEDMDSPWFRLMTNSKQVDTYAPNSKQCFLNLDEYDEYSKLKRFAPSTSWALRKNTLAVRRNLLLQLLNKEGIMSVTPLEMLIRYRGNNPLPTKLHEYYQSAVGVLLLDQRNLLTMKSAIPLLMAVCNNFIDPQDVEMLKSLLNDDYLDIKVNVPAQQLLISKITSQLQNSHDITLRAKTPTLKFMFLNDRLLHTRYDYSPVISNPETIMKMFQILQVLRSYEIQPSVLQCFSPRNRRNVFSTKKCHFSAEDIDKFNEAVNCREITEIRVNSDRFLKVLASDEYRDDRKGRQLIRFVRELRSGPLGSAIITGNSIMVVQELLQYGSLSAFRQFQRVTDIFNGLWSPLPNTKSKRIFPLLSRSLTLYAASSIPIIRGLHATIAMCLQQRNDTHDNSCWYGSAALASSVTLSIVSVTSNRFVPWMIHEFSKTALEILPSGSAIMRENIKLMELIGLKFGVRTVGTGLALVGVGFDVYNIVEMSKIINMCTQQGNNCSQRDTMEAIISLTFSCISIAVTGGLMVSGVGFVPTLIVGLGLAVLEEIAKGINDVVYYSNNYDTDFSENFRSYWHKIGFQPLPADVQALIQRREMIKKFQQHANFLLESSKDNIVAYGTGLGVLTADSIIAGNSYINMENANSENTRGLSRVLPTASDNTTLLCLPQQDTTQIYDKYENNVLDAVYRCSNAFVIAHKQRWKTRTSDKSYIAYDLALIESGKIVGSNSLNNLFFIYNSTLEVIGGRGNITNTFIVREDSFRGTIKLNNQSRNNILDFSATKSPTVNFFWFTQLQEGCVMFGDNDADIFFLRTKSKSLANLHVMGRAGKQDIFNCEYKKPQRFTDNEVSVTIYGGGGRSSTHRDHVIDCKHSMVQPFTDIMGSTSVEAKYTTYVSLMHAAIRTNTIAYATIQPQQSNFIVTFINYPLLASVYSVQYTPLNKTLTWTLSHVQFVLLHLSIVPYRSPYSKLQENSANKTNIGTVNCVFIDSKCDATIYPVINLPDDGISTVPVQQFNIFATVNSSRLEDVIIRYRNISMFQKDEFFVMTKLSYPTTGQTFIFGSNANDRFYIDANTTFLSGNEGYDIYTLNRRSSEYVWIQNEAKDDALDTLVIPEATCVSLRAKRGSLSSDCCDSSLYDVTLSCSVENSTATKSGHINVILQNYFVGAHCRHLQIYWRDATYVLLPYHWTEQLQESADVDANKNVDLAFLFSFSTTWQTTTLTLTSADTYAVFNITDDINSLVAYNSGANDIIVATRYFNQDTSSFVVLKDFFGNDTKVGIVSAEWRQFKIFIINNTIEDTIPTTLTVDGILNLLFETLKDNITYTQSYSDVIKEYFVNMSIASQNNTITIEHNNESATRESNKLGVLTVTGAEPKQFRVDWDHSDKSSLSLCAQQTCINMKNWCQSNYHRLDRIEFVRKLPLEPIVIRNLDQLECPAQASNNSFDDSLIKQLKHKFSVAQKELLLTSNDEENDKARLKRCVGSIIADNIGLRPLYRLFGFASIIDQVTFIRDNCNALFTTKNLNHLTLNTMSKVLKNRIKRFLLNKPMQEEAQSVYDLRVKFSLLSSECWDDFKSSLYNHVNVNDARINNTSSVFQIADYSKHIFKCVLEA